MSSFKNNEIVIMSRDELTEKSMMLCYGFNYYNFKEEQLIKALVDIVYSTFYDKERKSYQNVIDWNLYYARIDIVNNCYGNDKVSIFIYERVISKLFINF